MGWFERDPEDGKERGGTQPVLDVGFDRSDQLVEACIRGTSSILDVSLKHLWTMASYLPLQVTEGGCRGIGERAGWSGRGVPG